MRRFALLLTALLGLSLGTIGIATSASATTGVPAYIQNRLDSSGPIGVCQLPNCTGRLDWAPLNRGQRSDDIFTDATAVTYAGTARVQWYKNSGSGWVYSGCRTTTKANPIVSFYGGNSLPVQVRLTAGITC